VSTYVLAFLSGVIAGLRPIPDACHRPSKRVLVLAGRKLEVALSEIGAYLEEPLLPSLFNCGGNGVKTHRDTRRRGNDTDSDPQRGTFQWIVEFLKRVYGCCNGSGVGSKQSHP
jgi:hypothetical protein